MQLRTRGSMMKKLFLATTALIVLAAASAEAADIYARPAYTPPPAAPLPVYTWTGMYWGANVGYSWGKSKYDATLTGVGTVSNSQNIDGAVGGVQTGYNYQFGAWHSGLRGKGRLNTDRRPASDIGYDRRQAPMVWNDARPPGRAGDAERPVLRHRRRCLWPRQEWCDDHCGRRLRCRYLQRFEGWMDRGRRRRRSLRRRLERQTRISLYGPRPDSANIQRPWTRDDRHPDSGGYRQHRARRSELQMGRWLLITNLSRSDRRAACRRPFFHLAGQTTNRCRPPSRFLIV